jgi:hypothetical protein
MMFCMFGWAKRFLTQGNARISTSTPAPKLVTAPDALPTCIDYWHQAPSKNCLRRRLQSTDSTWFLWKVPGHT